MKMKAILCVDDEKIILDSLKTQLEIKFGERFMYETAESAEEAWEVIDELGDDDVEIVMVISDWLMPKVKGDEFLIAVHNKTPAVKTILLTGQADDSAVQNAVQNANLFAYIRKPWKTEQLMARIAEALK